MQDTPVAPIDPTDKEARYKHSSMRGVAFYLLGWVEEEQYQGDVLVCTDEDCDHQLSEMCWAQGGTDIVQSDSQVKAVMVGDDRIHFVDVDDLTKIDDSDYCGSCGQIGCGHG